MKKVSIDLPNNPYDIYIQSHILEDISPYIDVEKEYVIITDQNVPLKWVDLVKNQLPKSSVFTVPGGETSKSMETANEILEWMVEHKFTRSTWVIALGGGVIGDLAGMVASLYMRGVSFIQIPTTLLSQIDSSVGGKVGVNASIMKNAFGAFYQPKLVLIDPHTLSTLADEHIANGMAEMIKYGMIQDSNLFEELEKYTLKEKVTDWIATCVKIKANVVLEDELDLGIRQILNYGHTIGHAIEMHSDYKMLHGEAVAIGMQLMAKPYRHFERLVNVLKKFELNKQYEIDSEALLSYIKTDKKASGDNINIILVEDIGHAILKPVKVDDLKEYMEVSL